MQDAAGEDNFQPVRDYSKNFDDNGYHYANDLVTAANGYVWANNQPMVLPVGSSRTDNYPTRVRLVLTGVYFDKIPVADSAQRLYQQSNIGSNYLLNTFGVDQANTLNVFLMNRKLEGKVTAANIANMVGGVATFNPLSADHRWVKIVSPYRRAQILNQADPWFLGGILNHEVGHVLGLLHTYPDPLPQPWTTNWPDADYLSDTPNNPNCWQSSDSLCAALGWPASNNTMDYNPCQCALSPMQLGVIDTNLNGRQASLVEACGSCAPTHAQFVLEAGGAIVSDGAYYNPRGAALRLNGVASFGENEHTITVHKVAGIGCVASTGNKWQYTHSGAVDWIPHPSLDTLRYMELPQFYAFGTNAVYRIKLETRSWSATAGAFCDSDSLITYIHTFSNPALVPYCPTGGGGSSARAGENSPLALAPNPAGAYVDVAYTLPVGQVGTLTLVNARGEQVRVVQPTAPRAQSGYTVRIPTVDLPEGLYQIVLTTAQQHFTARLAVRH